MLAVQTRSERVMSNVIDIVRKSLIESGHDGLYNADAECACLIDDLHPCGEDFSSCKFGYKHPGDSDSDFYVKDHKPTRTEDDRRPDLNDIKSRRNDD